MTAEEKVTAVSLFIPLVSQALICQCLFNTLKCFSITSVFLSSVRIVCHFCLCRMIMYKVLHEIVLIQRTHYHRNAPALDIIVQHETIKANTAVCKLSVCAHIPTQERQMCLVARQLLLHTLPVSRDVPGSTVLHVCKQEQISPHLACTDTQTVCSWHTPTAACVLLINVQRIWSSETVRCVLAYHRRTDV